MNTNRKDDKMKKIISIATIALMLGFFAGCNATNNTVTSDADKAKDRAEDTIDRTGDEIEDTLDNDQNDTTIDRDTTDNNRDNNDTDTNNNTVNE